jgi:hypothetical protein
MERPNTSTRRPVNSSCPGVCPNLGSPKSRLNYCYDHNRAYAEERRRSAIRAARVGNSKVGAELKGVRLMVRDFVEATVSGGLHPTVKKRPSEVVGLLQVYSRLAELEVASGEAPRLATWQCRRIRPRGRRSGPRGISSGRHLWGSSRLSARAQGRRWRAWGRGPTTPRSRG